jgi:hypothetical protein
MPAVAAAIPGVLINLAIGAAVNVGVGLISNAIFGSGDPTRTSRGVEMQPRAGVNQPVRVVFGEWATPGRFWHQNSYGTDNEYLQLVYECGRTEYEGLVGILGDGKAKALSGSNASPRGRVIDDYTKDGVPHAWVKYYTGAPGQVADPELVARADPPSRWPATKKMTGTAYAIVTVRYNEEVFEGGLPQWTFVWRGAKFYDRRKDSTQPGGSGAHRWGQPETYEWTKNPAVMLDNFRRGLWINGVRMLGIGVGESACDHARFVAAANLCDESVFYPDTGRTLPRYTFSGEVSDAEDQISVVRMFETAMAGYGAEFGGAYGPLPAQTMIPVMTLTDKDRVTGEDVSERTRLDPTETKTAYNGMFVSPENGWVEKEYGLRKDVAVETIEGGRRQGKLDLEFITAQETAGCVAEIFRRRDRYSATEVAVYGPKAAKLEPGDVVTRVSDLFGTIPMMVWGIKELPGAKYQITFRGWHNSIVPTPTSGFLPLLPTPIAAPVPTRPITVSGLLALAATQTSGPNTVPAIRVTWTPITDRTVDRVIIKYWRDGDPDDARYLSVDEPGAGIAVIEGVVPEANYVLAATIATTPPRTTIWSAERTVTTGPLTVGATPGPGSVDYEALGEDVQRALEWMNAGVRSSIEAFKRLGSILSEQDLDNYNSREMLKREIGVRLDTVEASFVEVIEVALGPGGAIATALSSLYAAMGGNSAQVNVRWQAQAGPTGYSARMALQAAVDDGIFRAATLMLDVPENSALPTRLILDAEQTVVTTDGGTTVQAMFDADGALIRDLRVGTIRGPGGASFWNLSTGAFRISGGT